MFDFCATSSKGIGIRSHILTILEQDPELKWQKLAEEFQMILNLRHAGGKNENNTLQEHRVRPKGRGMTPLNTCSVCGGIQFKADWPFKNKVFLM